MGGMMSMSVGLRLQRNKQLQHKFRGAVMGCVGAPWVGTVKPSPVNHLLARLTVNLLRLATRFADQLAVSLLNWLSQGVGRNQHNP